MSIEINNEAGVELDETVLQRLATFVLDSLHVHPQTEVGISLVDETAIERLHIEWMNEPGVTDVLSFPMDELRPGRPDSQTPAGLLGDIVICPQVALVQAEAAGHDLATEVNILLTHGMLHLLGFDHATPAEEAEMFGLQRDLVTSFIVGERRR